MKQKIQNTKMLRQRKFILVLPGLVLPFLTLMFWSLGGGKGDQAHAQTVISKGFNLHLPEAHLNEDKHLDKLSYYEKATVDSAKREKLEENDPNFQTQIKKSNETAKRRSLGKAYKGSQNHTARLIASPYEQETPGDSNEVKVYRKLAELNRVLNSSKSLADKKEQIPEEKNDDNPSENKANLDSLEQLMSSSGQTEGSDPELRQISGLLEKILDVQHPERVQEKIRQTSEKQKGEVFAVSPVKKEIPVTLLGSSAYNAPKNHKKNGFYSLEEPAKEEDTSNAIQAAIQQSQTLVSGSIVKLRLLNNVFINGVLIPRNNFLFGVAKLNGERLDINISNIRYRNSLFPVELSVYDLDGLEGIYMPGAITRDVAKQSADRAIQGLGLMALDPSWQAQAAGAGIEAAKTLISKKVKLIRVSVKAGYQVLLKDEKQKQGI